MKNLKNLTQTLKNNEKKMIFKNNDRKEGSGGGKAAWDWDERNNMV